MKINVSYSSGDEDVSRGCFVIVGETLDRVTPWLWLRMHNDIKKKLWNCCLRNTYRNVLYRLF